MWLLVGRMAVYLCYLLYMATGIAITSDKQSRRDHLLSMECCDFQRKKKLNLMSGSFPEPLANVRLMIQHLSEYMSASVYRDPLRFLINTTRQALIPAATATNKLCSSVYRLILPLHQVSVWWPLCHPSHPETRQVTRIKVFNKMFLSGAYFYLWCVVGSWFVFIMQYSWMTISSMNIKLNSKEHD